MQEQMVTSRSMAPPFGARQGNLGVLILDDSRFDRLRIRRTLAKSGFNLQIHEAATLEQMVSLLDRVKIDVFFVDYSLTACDGLDAVGILRRHKGHAKTPVIMIAGDPRPEIAEKALAKGCSLYMPKDSLRTQQLSLVLQILLCTSPALPHNIAAADLRDTRKAGSLAVEKLIARLESSIGMDPAKAVNLPDVLGRLRNLSRPQNGLPLNLH